MSNPRRFRVQPPPSQVPLASSQPDGSIINPVLGLDARTLPTLIPLGATPHALNFMREDNDLTPRSGLSNYGDAFLLGSQPVIAATVESVRGVEYNVVGSLATISWIDAGSNGTVWRPFTGAVASSNTNAFYSVAEVYNRDDSEKNAIFTNGVDVPKRWIVSQLTLSLLSSFASVESYAKYVTDFDDRAVFFNCGSSLTSNSPTRVRWSMRGVPSNYTDADAGFEDIANMRGIGTGIVAEQDRILLFSDQDIWTLRKRGDAFVFDKAPLRKGLGCPYPRTIAGSAVAGTFFLSKDHQVYRILGDAIEAVGPPIKPLIRDTIISNVYMWGAFNETGSTYQLHLSTTAVDAQMLRAPDVASNLLTLNNVETSKRLSLTGGLLTMNNDVPAGAYASGVENGYLVLYDDWPNRAFWLNTDYISEQQGPAWFLQDYGTQRISTGRGNMLINSSGTPYRLLSSQTNDDGVAIDARWRSKALRTAGDPMTMEAITEWWMEYKATSSSSVSIAFSTDMGASFVASREASLTSGNNTLLLPLTSPTARHNMFELRIADGGQPRISYLQVGMRAYSGRYKG